MGVTAPNDRRPIWVVSIVALLGAVTALVAVLNKDALIGLVRAQIEYRHQVDAEARRKADEAQHKAEDTLRIAIIMVHATPPPPPPDLVRQSVADAFAAAPTTEMKCRVVDVVINVEDQTLYARITPVEFIQSAPTFKGQCEQQLKQLAEMILAKGAFVPSTSVATKATDTHSTELRIATEKAVADGTESGAEGWMYAGLSDGHGNLIDPAARTIKETRAEGRVTTTHELTLHSVVPNAAIDQPDHTLGRIPVGSELDVLEVKEIAETVTPGSRPAGYVWVRAKLRSKGVGTASLLMIPHRALTRAHRAPAQTFGAGSQCAPYPETNSLHDARQRWIYVGQKTTGSDQFIAGTSLLDTPCVPRDGAVARLTQQARVFVGRDPHYPGVRPSGEALTAGTNIQVVGDVAGYPFDAVEDPSFCMRNPPPRRVDRAIPPGHKRYCVYVPFNPI